MSGARRANKWSPMGLGTIARCTNSVAARAAREASTGEAERPRSRRLPLNSNPAQAGASVWSTPPLGQPGRADANSSEGAYHEDTRG